ncbi:homogentisate 1,2-dioxygenase [uncultured Sphingomonas sp.]|uniref:homogentisate 1,2-dioxygenase n=1 Tax=uncultured Sphingomonas sp. TaxID=158754 RepID=UPI0025EA9177|nr:homogentisate 1,2-dioxygenase [uncultured Sphingomonas sp.]
MLLATLIALSLPQVVATHRDEACPPTPIALPRGMEGWSRPTAVAAAATAAKPVLLTARSAVRATLLPITGVTYAVPPAKPGAATSHGGLFAFDVARAGRYRVALGSPAWIDVLRGTMPVASVTHGHGPSCSTIRKMVDFDLKPGRHLLQIAGSEPAAVTLMVLPVD